MLLTKVSQTSGYPKDSINHVEHPDHNKPGFQVRATSRGYYGLAIREPGDVFKIQYARHFADCRDEKLGDANRGGLGWMERVDGQSSTKRSKSHEQEYRGAKPPPADPSERERKMKSVDQMTEDSMAEDKAKAEADVI